MKKNQIKIVGIDLGTKIFGYSYIHKLEQETQILQYDVLEYKPLKDKMLLFKEISYQLDHLIENLKPDHIAFEIPFYGKNVQTTLTLSRLQGMILAHAFRHKVVIYEYTPRKIKQSITGNGNASKEQVAKMLESLFHIDISDQPLDATDALAVAISHAFHLDKQF